MGKKNLFFSTVLIFAMLFIAESAMAEENSISSEDTERFLAVETALDKIERGCPYSFSDESMLSQVLNESSEMIEESIFLRDDFPPQKISRLLLLKLRIERLLAGPCFSKSRSWRGAQNLLFQEPFNPSKQKP